MKIKQIILFIFTGFIFSQADHTIEAGNFFYTPANLTINVGESVEWYNVGGFHDVNGATNTLTGNSFNNPEDFYISAVSGPASIGTYTFSVAGTYNYDCSIGSHAANGMVGTITVVGDEVSGCTDPEAYNCDDNDSYIFQIGATVYDNTCDTCSSGVPCDGFYNPEATVDDGSCRYYQAPSDDEVTFSTGEGVISIDWSGFTPPELSIIDSYHVQRCVGEGCTWVEGTWPFNSYQGTSIDDLFGWENEAEEIKYAFAVKYSNNPYWGWAISSINFSSSDSCSAGDVNSDSTINILDVVSIVQYVLANVDYNEDQVCAADINGDSTVNILDIVALVQLILGG
ncbi:MAG: hypothetical protein CBD58_02860 [bacterium TMED198]|nr:MAG: hypothetical protein CBD58_02860 [bacterium TMED198]